ncbi:hypothetical protein C730_04875 [Helicobacter pylori Rif2]|nr:hypothetical protein C694_04875 [Helicobacter pylori 26695]AFV43753.1 hypothetical protein C695_04875 [Helicobacter pylori Rif1]AFV45346.1 hypothetical protein C730_04875 [Helicobacter pylori Rif2]EIE29680.1 hypothetical protein HP2RS_08218 [Helicobacter pylori]OUC11184.1 hypothetical protein X568_02060 [Helicobacter pylori SS1]
MIKKLKKMYFFKKRYSLEICEDFYNCMVIFE